MVYSGVIVTEEQIALMSGELVDGTGDTEANHNDLAAQAEAFLSSLVKHDIVTNWGTINAKTRQMLSEYAARYAAMTLIMYNMGTVGATFSSLIEPEDMVQLHIHRMTVIQKVLEDSSVQDFMGV